MSDDAVIHVGDAVGVVEDAVVIVLSLPGVDKIIKAVRAVMA